MFGSDNLHMEINGVFFDSNPLPMWIVDQDRLRFLEVNNAALEHYGYTHEEFLNLSPLTIRPKEDFEIFINYINTEINVLTNLGVNRHFKKDGTIIKVEIYANDITFKGEKARLIMCHDVTAKLFAEEKLLQSQTHLMASQRISNTGSWEITFTDLDNLSNNEIYWSDQAFRIFGHEPESIRATRQFYLSHVHEDDIKNIRNVLANTINAKSDYESEHRIIRTDGVERIVRLFGKLVFDAETKEPLKIIGTIQDITEEKAAQKQLTLLSKAAEQSPISIVITDIKGNILFANPKFTAISGYTTQEVIGKNPRVLKSGHTTDSEYKNLWATISSGKKWEGEFYNKCKDGSFYWESAIITPVISETGEIMNYLAIKTDITERKQQEELRDKMLSELVQRNKDLEQFTYIVSHNLRAPVANIKGAADMLINMELNNDEEVVILKGINESIVRLDDVILDLNNILNLKHNIKEKNEPIILSEIVEDIKLSLQDEIDEALFQVNADFSEINELNSFKTYIYSIFYNLITNSIKYRRADVDSKTEIKSTLSGNKIKLSFKDNGIGINLEEQGDQLFGLYKRFHFHTEGKGIGLHLVKTQVETLGGVIGVKSEVNKGTEFIISFDL